MMAQHVEKEDRTHRLICKAQGTRGRFRVFSVCNKRQDTHLGVLPLLVDMDTVFGIICSIL